MIRGTHRPHQGDVPVVVCWRSHRENPRSLFEACAQQSASRRRSAPSFNSLVRGAPAAEPQQSALRAQFSTGLLRGAPATRAPLTVEGMAYIRLYFGPLPPSRGVQRGPSTSVALQSTQFGAFTRSRPSTSSYTPAGHTWV